MEIELKIPQSLLSGGPVVLGVDEAGRGPVLGPMVYAVAFWLQTSEEDMKKQGYDDSKKLSEEDRDRLFEMIKADDRVGYALSPISARSLSEQMLRTPEPVSLNKIAQDATITLINKVIAAGIKIDAIYVDALGNCETYAKLLGLAFPNTKITVTPKADALFKVVSAASICAKVRRDSILAGWKFRENVSLNTDWGCGYPSDEKTKKWLMENVDRVFGFPEVVRFSWQTSKNILESTSRSDDMAAFDRSKAAYEVTFSQPNQRSLVDLFKRVKTMQNIPEISSADHARLGV